jgi:hypothetical protein
MRSGKQIKQDSGLPLAIFAQAFPRSTLRTRKYYLRDLLTYAYDCIAVLMVYTGY